MLRHIEVLRHIKGLSIRAINNRFSKKLLQPAEILYSHQYNSEKLIGKQ